MNVLNVLSSKSDNVEAALSVDLIRERRARLESEFVQVATYAMIYVGVGMDTITGVGVERATTVRAQRSDGRDGAGEGPDDRPGPIPACHRSR
jgi:hypothetical protein